MTPAPILTSVTSLNKYLVSLGLAEECSRLCRELVQIAGKHAFYCSNDLGKHQSTLNAPPGSHDFVNATNVVYEDKNYSSSVMSLLT